MRIPFGLIFIGAVIIALAVLAPDSKIGRDLRNTGSAGASFTGSLFDAIGRGSRELGDVVSE